MTDEQFWKLCGFLLHGNVAEDRWYLNGNYYGVELPPIDLEHIGFLFWYAVPKVTELGYWITMHTIIYTSTKEKGYDVEIHDKNNEMISWIDNKDPAQALKEAIYKALGGKK